MITLASSCLYIMSYLSGREHFVAVDGRRSSTVELSAGVLQGAILGSLVFAILTTSLMKLMSSYSILYHQFVAILSCSLHCHQVTRSFESRRDLCLSRCCDWLAFQYLGRDSIHQFHLKVEGTRVTLDCHLSFDDHITSVVRVRNDHIRALIINRQALIVDHAPSQTLRSSGKYILVVPS